MKKTDGLPRLRSVALIVLAMALAACGADEPTKTPVADRSVAGTYVLDREDYLRGLLADAESWVKSTASERLPSEQAKVRAESRDKAHSRAASARFELTVDANGTFRMEIDQGKDMPPLVGHGTWKRAAARLTLETQKIDGGPEAPDVPPPPGGGPPLRDSTDSVPLPPPIEATVDGDTLIVKPGPGVPFEHRLIRSR